MSTPKVTTWLGEGPQPNTFFFGSPFRSWKFLINTGLVVAVFIGFTFVAWKFASPALGPLIFVFMLWNVIIPYWVALQRHGRVNELYLSGQISQQTPKSPLNQLLEIADASINEGLRNSSFLFGLLLIFVWKFHHLK
jgi:hypothetical protein